MRNFPADLSAHQSARDAIRAHEKYSSSSLALEMQRTALEAIRAHERYSPSSLVRELQQTALDAIRSHERYSRSSLICQMQRGVFGTDALGRLAAGNLTPIALQGLIASDRLVAGVGLLDSPLKSVRFAASSASSMMRHLWVDQEDPLRRITAALGTASLLQGFDRGLLYQSVAAAAIVRAARHDASIYDQVLGRSFAFDAFAEIESFQERLDHEADVEGSFAALLETIVSRFAMYITSARTGFERDSLTQMLFLLMAAATLMVDVKTLMVSIESRNIAIESLEVARSEADESARDLGTIRDALNGQRSAQEEHTAKILVILQQIRDALDEPNMAADGAPRYIVKRQVELKTEQRMRSDTIAILFPNQVVRLITRRGKWIEVEYYDHLAGRTHSGWVVKKHLRVLR